MDGQKPHPLIGCCSIGVAIAGPRLLDSKLSLGQTQSEKYFFVEFALELTSSSTPRVHLDGNPPGVLADKPTSADPAKPSCLPTSNWQLCGQGVGVVGALTHVHRAGWGWPDDKSRSPDKCPRGLTLPAIMDSGVMSPACPLFAVAARPKGGHAVGSHFHFLRVVRLWIPGVCSWDNDSLRLGGLHG
jgi:hypothetical protein